MTVLQVCAFAAIAEGNFIPTLATLEDSLRAKGIDTVYAFPERAMDKDWCIRLQKRNRVYFLPEAKARIMPKTYKLFRRIYRENDISIVHSHFELYDIPATVTAPKRTKIYWHLHDPIKEYYKNDSVLKRLLTRFQYGVASKRAELLSVSKEHGTFAKELGFDEKRIRYFPNGINTSRINTKMIDKTFNKDYMLLFGWEVYRKGVDVLVEATNYSGKYVPIKVVGQEACEEYIREHSTSPYVQYSAPVLDISELYKNAVSFLHISRAEGLSYALLEAIYAGLPVICSNIPENAFASEFKEIIWIESGNSEELRSALESFNGAKGMIGTDDVEYNRSLILEKYSLNKWVSNMLELYLGEKTNG